MIAVPDTGITAEAVTPTSPGASHACVYLDYAATTPIEPEVLRAMLACMRDGAAAPLWANASSMHAMGRRARAAVEEARARVAALIHAQPDEVLFTSSATESNNLALKGAVEFNRREGVHLHLVTSRTEHRSVVDTCRWLERHGVEITWLVPERDGRIPLAKVLGALRPGTLLVSLMWVNNETGAVQDIEALAFALSERGVLLHVDAVQAAGKLAIDLARVPVDLLSLSAHKIRGPKGVGALFVRRHPRVRLAPQLHGGGHEQGMRSGTLANHQIVGMGVACELALVRLASEATRLAALRERLWRTLSNALPDIWRNGPDPTITGTCAPHILNVSFGGVDGEALRASLPGLAVSSGSACTAADGEPSFVLRALGRDDALADASLRFSFGHGSVAGDVETAALMVVTAVRRLRRLSPCASRGETAPVDAEGVVPLVPPADPFDYPDVVWRRFWETTAAGTIAAGPGAAGVKMRSPAARASLELSVKVADGRIELARFRALGGPHLVATGAWLAERLAGAPIDALGAVRAADVREALQLDEMHLYCALLGEDVLAALRRALEVG